MADAVHGSDVVIEMLVDDVYYPILCGTDCTFSRTPEFIPITTTTSGLFRDFMVRREEWSMSASGLTKIANATTLTFFYMLQTSVRRVSHDIRITFTDNLGGSKQITGTVLIGQMDINGPFSDFSQCTIELKGTGAYTIADTEPPIPGVFDILSDVWETTNGQNYVDGASTGDYTGTAYTLQAGDVLLQVDVEGTGFDIITSGTPGNRQCKLNPSTFVLAFASDMIFDGTQKVFIEFNRPA